MSGIAAIYYRDGRQAGRSDIERVARALRAYGPEQLLIEMNGSVAFAYAHYTSTIEDRFSRQPIKGGEGRFTMVFDGRLDNREELADGLGLSSNLLSGLSDGELAMLCWERWGDASLNRWIGEFALINWDRNEKRLTAARDQFGMRTLHFNTNSSRVVIASAPKCIHALGDVSRELDEQKIADALSQLYHDGERTFFKNVERLAPASLMELSGVTVKIKKYYDFRDHVSDIRYANDDDYVEAARELFDNSVRAMLRSSKPVGAFMSGGLDSSAMSVHAARFLEKQDKRLITFTSVPEVGWDRESVKGMFGDETPYVEAIAEMHSAIELNLVDGAGLGHYHKQDELLLALEMPVRNALNLQWTHAILEKARDRGVGVMLQGVFGNATLSHTGDGIFRYLLRNGSIRQFYKELTVISPNPRKMFLKILNHLIYPSGPNWLWNTKERLRGRLDPELNWRRFATANPAFSDDMDIPGRIRQANYLYHGGKPQFAREAWFNVISKWATDTGDTMQGLRAMYGIEIRDPFANRRLMEWSFGVPEDQFHRNGVNRWLIRRMMKGSLPESVLHNKKTGHQTADWHLRMTRDLPKIRKDLERFADDPDLSRMIDIPRMQRFLNDWPEENILDLKDDRFLQLQINLPMTLQIARFVQQTKGVNVPD